MKSLMKSLIIFPPASLAGGKSLLIIRTPFRQSLIIFRWPPRPAGNHCKLINKLRLSGGAPAEPHLSAGLPGRREIIKVGGAPAPPNPPFAPAYRPVIGSIINYFSAGLLAGGKSLRSGRAPASPEPPFAPASPAGACPSGLKSLRSGGAPAPPRTSPLHRPIPAHPSCR